MEKIQEKISSQLLQKIKDSINIIEIIGEHVVLRKAGVHYVGLCPFHSERSPSFSVSEAKQLYHCYGCKRGGDLISFVMEILGLSFPEAVEELAERVRIPLKSIRPGSAGGSSPNAVPNTAQDTVFSSADVGTGREADGEGSATARRREKLALAYKLNRFVASYYHRNLALVPKACSYLAARGVSSLTEIPRLFYIGGVSDAWDSLAREIIEKQAPISLALELGLIRPSTNRGGVNGSPNRTGVGYFDLFRNRVLFPILNLRGKVAGFGGRTLGEDPPKYLNSPESLTFQKSKLVFGLYQAQKYIREMDEVILVEGYFDVLALQSIGIRNVVATCGTALTADHLRLLKRFAGRLTVLFDGDSAGVAATEKAMETGLGEGWVLYGAQLPGGLDPDQVVMDSKTGQIRPEGQEQMRQLLTEARPLLDHKIDSLFEQAKDPESQSQALKRVGGWLGRFRDPVGRDVRIQHLQKKVGISEDLIRKVMSQSSGIIANQPVRDLIQKSRVQARPSSGVGKMSRGDQVLISGVILGGDYVKTLNKVKDQLPPGSKLDELLDYVPGKVWLESLFAFDFKESDLEPEAWEKRWRDPMLDAGIQSVAAKILVGGHEKEPSFNLKEFNGLLSRGVRRSWARFSQQIKAAIKTADVEKNIDKQSRLMKEYLDVQRKMKEFSSFYDEE